MGVDTEGVDEQLGALTVCMALVKQTNKPTAEKQEGEFSKAVVTGENRNLKNSFTSNIKINETLRNKYNKRSAMPTS